MVIKIIGGTVIDPGRLDGQMDIVIENGRISKITPAEHVENGSASLDDQKALDVMVIDASGKIVTPGLLDMHVHLREPGHEYKETIRSGCEAAAAGGFTGICPMPNTNPVNDNSQVTDFILEKAAEADGVRVYPVAAISKGLKGESLCEFADLKASGAVAFSDDGIPVMNSQLMRRALEYAKGFDIPIISHCEDLNLGGSGSMNEGPTATRMGLAGIPNVVESAMAMRDIALCELTGARLHIAHVSTAESVRAIRAAKASGIRVTAETAPHYFTLTDAAVAGYDTHAKMNPPLRSDKDREAIKAGLADGTIDAIATDHAPHSTLEKDVEFDMAANGIIGLETSVALSLRLVEEEVLTLAQLIEKMAINPARILGLPCGLKIGAAADITVIDTQLPWAVKSEAFKSLSINTPFEGWDLIGKAVLTMVNGKIVYDALTTNP